MGMPIGRSLRTLKDRVGELEMESIAANQGLPKTGLVYLGGPSAVASFPIGGFAFAPWVGQRAKISKVVYVLGSTGIPIVADISVELALNGVALAGSLLAITAGVTTPGVSLTAVLAAEVFLAPGDVLSIFVAGDVANVAAPVTAVVPVEAA